MGLITLWCKIWIVLHEWHLQKFQNSKKILLKNPKQTICQFLKKVFGVAKAVRKFSRKS